MQVKDFLCWYRIMQRQRNAYRFFLLEIAERTAKEKAQLAVTN